MSEDKERKAPRHVFTYKLNHAYRVDLSLLGWLAKQVAPFASKPLTFKLEMQGGYELSSEDLQEIQDSPFIATRRIESIAVHTDFRDPFSFSFSLRPGLFSSVDLSGRGDPLLYDGLLKQIADRMRSCRPWYWPTYWFPLQIVLGVLIATGAGVFAPLLFPDRDEGMRTFVTSTLAVAGALILQKLLFARIEFLDGLSKRDAERRATWQAVIGGGVILAIIVSVASNQLSKLLD